VLAGLEFVAIKVPKQPASTEPPHPRRILYLFRLIEGVSFRHGQVPFY
jgi:hypothetical protein